MYYPVYNYGVDAQVRGVQMASIYERSDRFSLISSWYLVTRRTLQQTPEATVELVKQALDVRLSAQTVELFQRGKRVASHPRSTLKGRHTTVAEHMPQAHRQYASWTPESL